MFGNGRSPGWFEIYIKVESNTRNLDVAALLKQKANWDKTKDKLRAIIEISPNVSVYSDDPTIPALSVKKQDFRDYDQITLLVKEGAQILGAGGASGFGGTNATTKGTRGGDGGFAIYATRQVILFNHGKVYGGGGGGGGGGGHTSITGGTQTGKKQESCNTHTCKTYTTEEVKVPGSCKTVETDCKEWKGGKDCKKKDGSQKTTKECCKSWNKEERCKYETKYKYSDVSKCFVKGFCNGVGQWWEGVVNCVEKQDNGKPKNTGDQVGDCYSPTYSGATKTDYAGGTGGVGQGFNTPRGLGQNASSTNGGKGGAGGDWGAGGSSGSDGSTSSVFGDGGNGGAYATNHVVIRRESTGQTAGSFVQIISR